MSFSLAFYDRSFHEVILTFLKPFGGFMHLKLESHSTYLLWEPLLLLLLTHLFTHSFIRSFIHLDSLSMQVEVGVGGKEKAPSLA